MHEKPGTMRGAATCLIVAGLLLAYIAAYSLALAPLGPGTRYKAVLTPDGQLRLDLPTEYRVGGPAVAVLFWPINQVDHKIRPGRWHP
jgi:hypothetical protein